MNKTINVITDKNLERKSISFKNFKGHQLTLRMTSTKEIQIWEIMNNKDFRLDKVWTMTFSEFQDLVNHGEQLPEGQVLVLESGFGFVKSDFIEIKKVMGAML